MPKVYCDRIAATPLLPEVREAMRPYLEGAFGKPQSLHAAGREAQGAVEAARADVAALVGARPDEVYFTASGSEANNFALKGLALGQQSKGRHLVVSAVEHSSVLNSVKALERLGFTSSLVPVDRTGRVDPADVAKALTKETTVVSVMTANSEVGTIEPVAEIASVCRERGVLFHTDAVAAAGSVPLDVKALGVDALSLAGDQFYGPKGSAALFVRKGVRVLPLVDGGIQEGGRRGGTENVPAIAGLGAAARLAARDMAARSAALVPLRDKLLEGLPGRIERVAVTGSRTDRLPHHASFCVEFVEGEGMLLFLDMKGVAVSSGSACTSKSLKASHVLLAMGYDHALAQGSLVFSLVDGTTAADVDYILETFPPIVDRLRKMSPLYTAFLKERIMMYSDKVMDHFANPRNVGVLADADGVGEVGNPVCGDMMTFYVKIDGDRLADVKFQTFGCGAAIAVSSMVSEMAKGKTIDEAMAITNESVAEELGGLPKNKMHCSNLGADALHEAIKNYRDRKAGRAPAAKTGEHDHSHDEGCACPYCDTALEEENKTFCRACRVEFEECPACGGITKKGDAKCVHCGAALGAKG